MRVCAPQVFKATIARGSMGNVAAITAAIKTLKTHDSNGRAELLREAALMVSAANHCKIWPLTCVHYSYNLHYNSTHLRMRHCRFCDKYYLPHVD